MTDQSEKKLGQLISRMLDGELSLSGADEFGAIMETDKQAARRLEEYRRNDELAAGAMRLAMLSGARPLAARPFGARFRLRGMAAAAIVAAVLAAWAIRSAGPVADRPAGPTAINDAKAAGLLEGFTSGPARDIAEPADMAGSSHNGQRVLERRYFGIRDQETGKTYILRADRERTIIQTVSADF